ncbi:MAG: hypothetical protein AMJ94_19505 [Deltaproteobacteria bacterium SM23_61]|nr:MAG: hypothetical protein AMJ94_19505 [Deltaproteobacteria bacterium SM23_61]
MLEHTLILILTAVLMFLGLLGSILPALPGTPLILLGALVYAWYTGFTVISWMTLLALLVLTILSYFLDVFASALGVKKLGGSRWGMAGALLGAIIGLVFGGLLGLILGPFVGAFLLELAKKKDPAASLRSGVGTLLGFLAGTIGKLILAAIMIGIFVVKLIV